MSIDISALRRNALAATARSETIGEDEWYTQHEMQAMQLGHTDMFPINEQDASHIAACDPQTILALLDVVQAAPAVLTAMAECLEIARQWEPDDSSGKARQWLVRGRDTAAVLRASLEKVRP